MGVINNLQLLSHVLRFRSTIHVFCDLCMQHLVKFQKHYPITLDLSYHRRLSSKIGPYSNNLLTGSATYHHNSSTYYHNSAMAKIFKSSIPYKGPATENLIEFLKNGLRKHSDQVLLIDSGSGRAWTGNEIETILSRLARYLIDQCGLQKGDVCSVYGPPNDLMVLVLLSVISAGGVSNFLTDEYKARELLDTAKTINSKFVISCKKLLQSSQSALSEIDDIINVMSCDEICDGFKNGCKLIEPLLKKDSTNSNYTCEELIDRARIDVEKDFAVIQFSSGTTGKPKPIPRTHKNLCHLVASVDHKELMDLNPGDVITGSLAVTHRPGLWALLASINNGSTFVLWNNLSDVHDALRTIEKYKVTLFSSSLPFLAMLGNVGVKCKGQYNLSTLKHVITSGAKILNSDLPNLLIEEFNLISLRQCFGMTEAGWVFLIEKSLAKDNYLTPGHVCPSMEAIIIDRETGEHIGPGIKGEIAIRGPQIFPGYLTEEQEVFNRSDFTEDGWFKTGDQGYFDDNGLVFIEGRYKELLVLKNNARFFPNEIETVISEHPSVEGVCVVKIGTYNEEIVYDLARAYVTLKQGCQLTEKEVMDYISERSCYALLDGGVKFLDKFPRLENGKVNKQALKEIS